MRENAFLAFWVIALPALTGVTSKPETLLGLASCKCLEFRLPGMLPAGVQAPLSLGSGPKTLPE